jgi:hypothetical protein
MPPTVAQVRAAMPTGTYPRWDLLVSDVVASLRRAFSMCFTGKRDTQPVQAKADPRNGSQGVVEFRPADTGKVFQITVKENRVFDVLESSSQ